MAQESHIETRTPEEMRIQAYNRIIQIGDAVIKERGPFNPKPWNTSHKRYSFDWDKKREYAYLHASEDGFYYNFMCLEDKAFLVITKYSERPKEI